MQRAILSIMFRRALFALICRCAVLVALACVAALVVNAARYDGLPVLPGRVPCPGIALPWWTRIQHLDAAQAHALWEQRAAVFVDARSHQDYIFNHLPGALEMPYRDFSQALARSGDLLARDGLVVIYDGGKPCGEGVRVSKRLSWARVALLDGGFPAWEQAGYPVQGGHERGEVGRAP
jgi:rhodanese-related sulfurtransferase